MKKSLKQAINIFPYKHRIILIFELICRKFGSTIGKKGELILARCEQYVQLIEKGVFIQRKTQGLLKMKFLVNEKEYSFFIREKSSDIRVFESVILLEEYKIAKEQLSRQENGQNVIIDAGANIGFTTIYFHAFFENARFVLVEPDPDNCKMLKNNLLINNINNVSILQNALWINEDQLILDDSFRDGMEWSLSIQVKEDHLMNSLQRLTKGITINSISEKLNINSINLFKIDIEGSERILFGDESFNSFVKKNVANLVIEIHDEFNVRNFIYQIMKDSQFKFQESGDLTLFQKI